MACILHVLYNLKPNSMVVLDSTTYTSTGHDTTRHNAVDNDSCLDSAPLLSACGMKTLVPQCLSLLYCFPGRFCAR